MGENLIWGCSSVGSSDGLLNRRSWVQVPPSPPFGNFMVLDFTRGGLSYGRNESMRCEVGTQRLVAVLIYTEDMWNFVRRIVQIGIKTTFICWHSSIGRALHL